MSPGSARHRQHPHKRPTRRLHRAFARAPVRRLPPGIGSCSIGGVNAVFDHGQDRPPVVLDVPWDGRRPPVRRRGEIDPDAGLKFPSPCQRHGEEQARRRHEIGDRHPLQGGELPPKRAADCGRSENEGAGTRRGRVRGPSRAAPPAPRHRASSALMSTTPRREGMRISRQPARARARTERGRRRRRSNLSQRDGPDRVRLSANAAPVSRRRRRPRSRREGCRVGLGAP